jgi:hypothetical protein
VVLDGATLVAAPPGTSDAFTVVVVPSAPSSEPDELQAATEAMAMARTAG